MLLELSAFALVLLLLERANYYIDARRWNNGVSPHTGQHWRYFDRCHGGDRGYTDGKNYIWIGHPLVDKFW